MLPPAMRLALISMLAAACSPAIAPPPSHTVLRDTAFVSERFRFALGPLEGWRVRPEPMLVRAEREDGRAGAVIAVEPMPGLELEQAAALAMRPLRPEVISRERVRFCGRDAVRQVTRTEAAGVALRYAGVLFLDRDHLYRIDAWAEEPIELEPFFDSFSLVPGDI